MSIEEIKGKVDNLGTAWEEFKSTNDQRLAEIEKKGSADPVLEEKLKKINETLSLESEAKKNLETELKEQKNLYAKLEAAVSRPDAGDNNSVNLEQKEYQKAFNAFIRKGAENGLQELEQKALSVNSDPDGGYTVTPEMGGIITGRVFETSPIRQVASVQTISTDAYEFLDDNDEASAGWVDEEGSRATTDTPTMDKRRIVVQEIYAKPRATQKMLDDSSINVEQYLANKVSDIFGRTENTAFVSGNGIGKPRGFLTYSNWASAGVYESGKVEQIASGTQGSVTGDGLVKLVYALKDEYKQNAVFMMARGTEEDVRLLKINSEANHYAWQPSLQAGQPATLLGYPVIQAADMPAVANDTLSIAFGDFRRGYQIVDRTGIRVLRDPYSAKPFVEFYTTKRVGGDVMNWEAIKIQALSN